MRRRTGSLDLVLRWFRGLVLRWFRGLVLRWFHGLVLRWFHGLVLVHLSSIAGAVVGALIAVVDDLHSLWDGAFEFGGAVDFPSQGRAVAQTDREHAAAKAHDPSVFDTPETAVVIAPERARGR